MVTVKNNYQVVIPVKVRKAAGIRVGDLLEAKVERGKVTFNPKGAVDRRLADALKDVCKGRVHGPFDTVEDMKRALKASAKKYRVRRT